MLLVSTVSNGDESTLVCSTLQQRGGILEYNCAKDMASMLSFMFFYMVFRKSTT